MPFAQLRSLVIALTEPDPVPVPAAAAAACAPELDDDDPVAEFETQPTTCLPAPRTSTIDQLIAALRYERFPRGSSPPASREAPPRSEAYTAPRTPAAAHASEAARGRRVLESATSRSRDRTRSGGGRGSPRR